MKLANEILEKIGGKSESDKPFDKSPLGKKVSAWFKSNKIKADTKSGQHVGVNFISYKFPLGNARVELVFDNTASKLVKKQSASGPWKDVSMVSVWGLSTGLIRPIKDDSYAFRIDITKNFSKKSADINKNNKLIFQALDDLVKNKGVKK